MKDLILASKSPYRKELLERLGIPFICENSGFDENPLKSKIKDPVELTQQLSLGKANAIKPSSQSIVLGSDQVCFLAGKILGKPGSMKNAALQLKEMSGQTHKLITSYALVIGKESIVKTNITELKMRILSSTQIERYLKKDQPLDCAGSYKLELAGISLMERIETTDHTAIMGLPLIELSQDLIELGFSIP